MNQILVLTIIIVGVFGGLYILSKRKTKMGDNALGDLAKSHGILVEKIIRLMPITEGIHLSNRLEEGECYSYSIQLSSPSHSDWKLLQRFGKEHKDADYWLFEKAGEPSADLAKAIQEFKAEFGEEYFEVESKDGRIHIYWQQWGDHTMISKIKEWLRNFADLSA